MTWLNASVAVAALALSVSCSGSSPATAERTHLDARLLDGLLSDLQLAAPEQWLQVAPGSFSMGSPGNEPCREAMPWTPKETQHTVTLTHRFQMQATEVTQAQFEAALGYNPSWSKDCGPTCPIEGVSWHEMAAYCNALSAKKGRSLCYQCTGSGRGVTCAEVSAYAGPKVYTCPGYRLPTEAEWEYAYRAGTNAAYHNGANDPSVCNSCGIKDATLDKIGWYCANAGSTTHAVASKEPNAWGLYDMAGNVDEWCHDAGVTDLGAAASTDPVGAGSGPERVTRGGGWGQVAYVARAAHRNIAAAGSDTGGRCVSNNEVP